MDETENTDNSPEQRSIEVTERIKSELEKKLESHENNLDSVLITDGVIALSEYLIPDNQAVKTAREFFEEYTKEGRSPNDGSYNAFVDEVNAVNNIFGSGDSSEINIPGGSGMVRMSIGIDYNDNPYIKLIGSGGNKDLEKRAEQIGIKDPKKEKDLYN